MKLRRANKITRNHCWAIIGYPELDERPPLRKNTMDRALHRVLRSFNRRLPKNVPDAQVLV